MAERGCCHGATGGGVQTFGLGTRSSYLPSRLALFGNSRRENTCDCSPHDAAAAQPACDHLPSADDSTNNKRGSKPPQDIQVHIRLRHSALQGMFAFAGPQSCCAISAFLPKWSESRSKSHKAGPSRRNLPIASQSTEELAKKQRE